MSILIPKESQFRFLDCFWPFFLESIPELLAKRIVKGIVFDSKLLLSENGKRNWDSRFLILRNRHSTIVHPLPHQRAVPPRNLGTIFLPASLYRFRVSAVNKYGYSDTLENNESVLIGAGGDADKDESVRNM